MKNMTAYYIGTYFIILFSSDVDEKVSYYIKIDIYS